MSSETAVIEKREQGLSLVQPGEPGWEAARSAWNLEADQHPAAVAYASDAEGVVAAVGFARRNGLRIAAQGTGHGAGAGRALGDTLLIRTERMKGIEIDAARGTARLEAGVIWQEAADAAAPHGLAVLSGSAPDAGVVGYSTGGGFGWLARKHGLAANSIVAAELVDAAGSLHRVDAASDPDLFWALRGGGGNFGVIIALEFQLVELSRIFAGSVIYPADERSGQIFEAYRRWTATVPDEITSIARFLQLPDLPDVPEPLRGRQVITLGAAYAGDPQAGRELIEPLRRLGEPVMDLFAEMAPRELPTVHMEPEEPVPARVDTVSLASGPAEAFAAFVDAAGPGSGSPLVAAELRQAGGAAGREPADAGAIAKVEGEFIFLGIGMPDSAEASAEIDRRLDRIVAELSPWAVGRRYFNFADRAGGPEELFGAAGLERLREVKRRVDPEGLIHGNRDLLGAPRSNRAQTS